MAQASDQPHLRRLQTGAASEPCAKMDTGLSRRACQHSFAVRGGRYAELHESPPRPESVQLVG
eukprot:7245266-Lingulodinium_polyedra.AAC.1